MQRNKFKEQERKENSEIAKVQNDFNKLMQNASLKQWECLVHFIKAVANVPYAYRRQAADWNRRWGEVSYLETYRISCGRGYKMMSKQSKAYKIISKAVTETKVIMGERDRLLSLDGIAKAVDGAHYVAFISGGNNGSPDWIAYLESLSMILKSQKSAWLIEMNRHSDVYYVLMGFKI